MDAQILAALKLRLDETKGIAWHTSEDIERLQNIVDAFEALARQEANDPVLKDLFAQPQGSMLQTHSGLRALLDAWRGTHYGQHAHFPQQELRSIFHKPAAPRQDAAGTPLATYEALEQKHGIGYYSRVLNVRIAMVQAAAIARSLSASADIFEIFRNLPGLAANRLPLTGFVFMFPPVHDLAQRDITCGGVRQIGERITYYPVRGIPESVHLLRVVGNRDPPLALFGHPIPNEAIWVMPNIGFLADELTVPTMDFLGGAIDYAYTRTGYNARMSWKNGIGAVFRIVAPAYVVQLFMLHVKRRPQDAPVLLRTLLADCETKIALRQDHYYGTPDRNDRVLYGTRDALEPLFNGNPGALYTPLQPSELASIEQAIRAGSVVLLSPRP